MKTSLRLIAFTTLLCFAFPRETEAGIYTWSGVEYDANTNSMRAYVGSQAAYEPGVYYCLESTGYIFQDEVEVGEVSANDINWSGWPSACTGYAYAETYLPYDPNAEYNIEAFHTASVTYEQQTSYVDYYNYIEYTYGDPVYYPYWYDFIGNGPPQSISFKNILL